MTDVFKLLPWWIRKWHIYVKQL